MTEDEEVRQLAEKVRKLMDGEKLCGYVAITLKSGRQAVFGRMAGFKGVDVRTNANGTGDTGGDALRNHSGGHTPTVP